MRTKTIKTVNQSQKFDYLYSILRTYVNRIFLKNFFQKNIFPVVCRQMSLNCQFTFFLQKDRTYFGIIWTNNTNKKKIWVPSIEPRVEGLKGLRIRWGKKFLNHICHHILINVLCSTPLNLFLVLWFLCVFRWNLLEIVIIISLMTFRIQALISISSILKSELPAHITKLEKD